MMAPDPSLAAGSQSARGLVRTFSLKIKARMAAESSAKKMIRMNRKNCEEKGRLVSPEGGWPGDPAPQSSLPRGPRSPKLPSTCYNGHNMRIL